ncbi:unnamed protein product, partial [Pylaiella littoralis]
SESTGRLTTAVVWFVSCHAETWLLRCGGGPELLSGAAPTHGETLAVNGLVVRNKTGCDWGSRSRSRRRDFLPSLALRHGRPEREARTGRALAITGYRQAQGSRRNEAH